jgi:hypothetical protein
MGRDHVFVSPDPGGKLADLQRQGYLWRYTVIVATGRVKTARIFNETDC